MEPQPAGTTNAVRGRWYVTILTVIAAVAIVCFLSRHSATAAGTPNVMDER